MIRASLAACLLCLSSCGGGSPGFHRPDYAAEAEARCAEAEATSDPHRALALFGLAIDADPKMSRAWLGRARILESTGRRPEAERSYAMAIDLAPDDVRPRYLLARAQYHRRQGRLDPAVRDLDRAIQLLDAWPQDELIAESRLMRAESRVTLHRWQEARDDLEAAEKAGLDAGQRERAKIARFKVEAGMSEKKP